MLQMVSRYFSAIITIVTPNMITSKAVFLIYFQKDKVYNGLFYSTIFKFWNQKTYFFRCPFIEIPLQYTIKIAKRDIHVEFISNGIFHVNFMWIHLHGKSKFKHFTWNRMKPRSAKLTGISSALIFPFDTCTCYILFNSCTMDMLWNVDWRLQKRSKSLIHKIKHIVEEQITFSIQFWPIKIKKNKEATSI